MRRVLFLVCLMTASVLLASPEAMSTAGFSEWDVPTPLGNSVDHTDPFIGQYGTSIRPSGHFESDAPFVVKVETWIFYAGYIAGKAEKGFFLFNEMTKETEYFTDEAEQTKRILEKGLTHPLSRPYDGGKGWREVWAENRNPKFASPEDLLKQTEQEFDKSDWFQKLPEDQKALRKEGLRKQMEGNVQFLREEYDFYVKVNGEISTYPEFQCMDDARKEKIQKYIEGRLKASTFIVEN